MGAIGEYLSSLSFVGLLSRLPAGVAQGLVWALMALGVYITFRILDIADLSVDGTFSTGGAVTAVLIVAGVPPIVAVLVAFVCGILAGMITGLLHTRLGIPAILAGILTQYALYSINLAIMGFKANTAISADKFNLIVSGRDVNVAIIVSVCFVAVIIALLYWFFGTERGMSIRSTGCNPQMSKAQGININLNKVVGLALSNGLVALSGCLFAQYSGYADVNSGRGAIVIGLAAVIIGEVLGDAILGKRMNFLFRMIFIAIGAIIYYMIYTIVLWLKMDPNMMKLFTAVIVAICLAVPYLKNARKSSFHRAGKNSAGGKKNA
ncbi:MAG: ABC transporter permease [Clostridiales bacterium]|nr:ABC transporter permease [Clostridiales bacterium]